MPTTDSAFRPTLLSDFLSALGVRYTESFTASIYGKMTFKSLFGLSKALQKYNIESAAFVLEDRDAVDSLDMPFVAQLGDERYAVITGTDPDTINGMENGREIKLSRKEFLKVWTGVVMLAFTSNESAEPRYFEHRFYETANKSKRWILWGLILCVSTFFFVYNGLWKNWATIALTVLDLAGIYISYLLVLKSLHVTSEAADAVCGVLQEHGCDKILERKASTFFGVFGWSAVGLSYFTVSLVALMIAPNTWSWLPWIGVCCLPFTIWSISYQKFVAKTWCTLCVTVQTLLWLEFFVFLFGGMLVNPLPFTWSAIILLAFYPIALLAVDKFENILLKFNNSYQQ